MARYGNHAAQPPLEVMLLQSAGDIIGLDIHETCEPEMRAQGLGQIATLASQQAILAQGKERYTAQLRLNTIETIAKGRSPYRTLREEYGLPSECTDELLLADAVRWLRMTYDAVKPAAEAIEAAPAMPHQRVGNYLEPATAADKRQAGGKSKPVKQRYVDPETQSATGIRDQGLLEAVIAGDVRAYGELCSLHHNALLSYASSRLPRHCEDVVQEAYLRGLKAIRGSAQLNFNRPGGAAGWFITIVKNIIYDIVKSKRHKLEISHEGYEHDSAGDEPSPVEREIERREEAAALREKVDRLNEFGQEVIGLRFYADLSVTETAVALGVNIPTSKSRQNRAIGELYKACTEPARPVAPAEPQVKTGGLPDNYPAVIQPIMERLEELSPTESARRARIIATYIGGIISPQEGASQLGLSPHLFEKYYTPLRAEVLASLLERDGWQPST